MPGKRISELTALSGAGSANNDDVVIFDADAGVTKRISRSQLAEGMQTDVQVFTSKTMDSANNTLTINAKEATLEATDGSRVHEFKDVAALLADTGLVATTGSVVRTRAEGFAYVVAASAATDQHVTTAGGVKLYALSVDPRAFGAVADGTTNDGTALTRALAAATDRVISLPSSRSRYLSSATFYGYLNSRFAGEGSLVLDGYAQARNRSFITNEVADPSNDRTRMFDGDWSKSHDTEYTFVGSAVGSTAITSYRNVLRASASVRIFESAGGVNTDPADHALGRTGISMDRNFVYQGGQGDLVGHMFYGEVFSSRPGATHWLANPAIIRSGFNLGPTSSAANGAFLNESEGIFADRADASVTVINQVRNYVRTNGSTGLEQVWIHDRPQSGGTVAADVVYSPAGPWKRLFDTAGADLGADGAALVLKSGEFLYGNAVCTPDSINARFYSQALGSAKIGYNGSKWTVAGGFVLDGVASDQTSWVDPTLLNSWVVADVAEFGNLRYRKFMGRVIMEGVVKDGSNFTIVCTLPAGFRPPKKRTFSTSTTFGKTEVQIWPDGSAVCIAPAGASNHLGFDGVAFDV